MPVSAKKDLAEAALLPVRAPFRVLKLLNITPRYGHILTSNFEAQSTMPVQY